MTDGEIVSVTALLLDEVDGGGWVVTATVGYLDAGLEMEPLEACLCTDGWDRGTLLVFPTRREALAAAVDL